MTFTESSCPVSQPINRKTITVTISDNGMAVRVIIVVRTFNKKRNKMPTTRMAPNTRASPT